MLQLLRVLGAMSVLSLGCGGSGTSRDAENNHLLQSSDARTAGSEGESPLTMWESGLEREAVQELLAASGEGRAIQWESAVFAVSESDVAGMTREERRALQEQVIEIAPVLKEIAKQCLANGDEALARGNIDNARHYFDAVSYLGQDLTMPERVHVLQSIGRLFLSNGADGLARCEAAVQKNDRRHPPERT